MPLGNTPNPLLTAPLAQVIIDLLSVIINLFVSSIILYQWNHKQYVLFFAIIVSSVLVLQILSSLAADATFYFCPLPPGPNLSLLREAL